MVLLFLSVNFGNLMKPKARVFKLTSPTKKISLNYHLNKFSKLRYCFAERNVNLSPTCCTLATDNTEFAIVFAFHVVTY